MQARNYINESGGNFLNRSYKINKNKELGRNKTTFNMNKIQKLKTEENGFRSLKRNFSRLKTLANLNKSKMARRQGILVAGKGMRRGIWTAETNSPYIRFGTNNEEIFLIDPLTLTAFYMNRNNRLSRNFKLGYSSYVKF